MLIKRYAAQNVNRLVVGNHCNPWVLDLKVYVCFGQHWCFWSNLGTKMA
ncbi:unnamed protein product [Brassica oleracea]